MEAKEPKEIKREFSTPASNQHKSGFIQALKNTPKAGNRFIPSAITRSTELELEELHRARVQYALENDLEALSLCFLMMGNVFRRQADYFLAHWYYYQSLYIYQKIGNWNGIVRSLQSLSSLTLYKKSRLV